MSSYTYNKEYDVIVVGAGHAGIEAALAAARMGCQTLLTTIDLDTIGKMSCNPAIGGLAKGHMVREIDAMGGQMGLTTDLSGIQFRMLNRKKGPAVWAPRAQCDKKTYQFTMKMICERQQNLDIRQCQCISLNITGDRVSGIDTSMGVRYIGKVVIITTGTFLRGLMHIGSNQQTGGRGGEQAALGLSENLKSLGFELCRLKTGTPPRLNRNTIDFSSMSIQCGDSPEPPFSFTNDPSYYEPHVEWMESDDVVFHVEQFKQYSSLESPIQEIRGWRPQLKQMPCYLTSTTHKTEEIIRSNLHRSPMYSGTIEGPGPRYCPSIEDKYVKFPDKETHQIFLEPEGINTDEIYVNGCSTSLPYDVQVDLVRSIRGLEQAEIMRAGYAVEYDYAPPVQLYPWLETKRIHNLFFAGQINGTTGYEEAAAQGFAAGVNAGLRVQNKEPYIFKRSESYIGVLVDDLVTKGTSEPYRMFTSRAEYRLLLRQDNADARLTTLGYQWGLITKERFEKFNQKQQRITEVKLLLKAKRIDGVTLEHLLRRPEVELETLLLEAPELTQHLPEDIRAAIEMDIKYEGYVQRDLQQVEKLKKMENQKIPESLDFQKIKALKRETREKLQKIRPQTLGQAGRVSGVTPADMGVLQNLAKNEFERNVFLRHKTFGSLAGQITV